MDKLITQEILFAIKDRFERNMQQYMKLVRVTVPLVVEVDSGLNDGLGWDNLKTPVSFASNDKELQVVQAATKWKRTALKKFDMRPWEGIVTDMRAIRKNEVVDNLHSLYVDQWDWEMVISEDNRNLEFLKYIVNKVWECLKDVEVDIRLKFPQVKQTLPEEIHFISAQELFEKYSFSDPKDRERAILKDHPAVFIYAIGHDLPDGSRHELRAADYDDWRLNGDLVVANKITGQPHELSSMGIRVNAKSLVEQLTITNQLKMLKTPYHQSIIENNLPLSIGGGIGQSRLYMLLLEKEHIKEVQESVWDD